MADRGSSPGPSRQDKGKAKVGEPSDLTSDDDQTQRNEPGPGSGDEAPLGPDMICCLSKTLTQREANPRNPMLYLEANETGTLIDFPDTLKSRSISFSKNLRVFDVDNRGYKMLLSHCVRGRWTGYSVAKDWEKFVAIHNLEAGDTIVFHRTRDKDILSGDYDYVLTYVKKKSEVKADEIPQENVSRAPSKRRTYRVTFYKNNIKYSCLHTPPEPKSVEPGPGSGYMPKEALCFSMTLTAVEVIGQYPKLHLSADEAFLLTNCEKILGDRPGRFSIYLVMFDGSNNRYSMNLSNRDTGSPRRFLLNSDWKIYARTYNLKQGDELEFYRFLDRVSGKYYYALRYYKKPPQGLVSSRGNVPSQEPSDDLALSPEEEDDYFCISRTLTSHDVAPTNPVFYVDAFEAYTLTDCAEFLEPPSISYSKMLPVFDDTCRTYNMLLSYCVNRDWAGYSISEDWGEFVRVHRLKAGDQIYFYRHQNPDALDGSFYDLKFVRKETEMTNKKRASEEKSPHRKRKPGPGSRVLPDNAMCFSRTLSAFEVVHHDGKPRLFLDAYEAGLLIGCPEIFDKYPLGTLLENLLVFDADNMPYDMFLSDFLSEDGEVIYTVDDGWQRFVKIHKLKAGDEIFFYRLLGESFYDVPYYAVRYTRKGPSGSGVTGKESSGSGVTGKEPNGSGQKDDS